MSLFKLKDWWNVECGSEEEFGQNSLCIANIDNNPDGSDKIIVGSLNGILRIFTMSSNATDEGGLPEYQAGNLLMEVDFKVPILQVSAGLLLSATNNIQLAVLHPRKLSIYSISSAAGVTEHGSSYNILLIYEHILQRSAFNMILGSFGQVKGRDFICVQSLDGNLSFYEQESLAFNRFLPNSLIPSALIYIPHSDSFVIGTASWTIESYRYQVLAIANSEENSSESKLNVKGRKVTSDWSLTLGESVIDIKVVLLEKSSYNLIVLGERNLYTVRENGTIWYMKKFDFIPTCLTAYPNDTSDSILTLVATHVNTILIYCNDTLKWAAQLPFTPIAIHRAFFSQITGAIVCLSDEGLLCAGYLGTNPSIKILSVPNLPINKVNYSDSESELQELRGIINSHNLEGNKSADNTEMDDKALCNDLSIKIIDVQNLFAMNGKLTSNPFLKLTIQLESIVEITNVRMVIDIHQSLIAEPNIVVMPSISNQSEPVINEIIILKNKDLFPVSPKVKVIVTYTNEDGYPRLAVKAIHIPINIFAKLGTASKEAEHKLSLEIINNEKSVINLTELFSDLFYSDEFNENQQSINAVGIEIYDDNNVVTVSTSVKSVNQNISVYSDSFGALSLIANELLRRLSKNNIKYNTSSMDMSFIPLNKLFVLIEQHLSARYQVNDLQTSLTNSATQFRAIEKRLLIKLKDRNPSPLNNLETLLKVAHTQITTYGEKLIKALNELHKQTAYLSSAVNLVCNLILIATKIQPKLFSNIQSVLNNQISLDTEEGWEERTELALISLIDNNGKEINTTKFTGELTIPENSNNLKRMINILVNQIFSGHYSNQINNHKKLMNKNEPIIEEEYAELNYNQTDQSND